VYVAVAVVVVAAVCSVRFTTRECREHCFLSRLSRVSASVCSAMS